MGKARRNPSPAARAALLASTERRDRFVKEPAKCAPQFGGFCSNGMVYAIPWGGDPGPWKIIETVKEHEAEWQATKGRGS